VAVVAVTVIAVPLVGVMLAMLGAVAGAALSVWNVVVRSVELAVPSFTTPYIVCVAVSAQKLCTVNVQLRCGAPAVELQRPAVPDDKPARNVRVSAASASAAPPVVIVTVPVFMHVGAADIEVSVGAVLEMTSADELVALVDAVQVVAIAVSWHTMLSPFTKLPEASVLAVCPAITAPFLYHL